MNDFGGRFQKGDVVPLAFVSKAGDDGVPTLPDAVPSLIVYNDSGPLTTKRVPVKDRYIVTAFFLIPLFIDANFSSGRHRAVFCYAISGTTYHQVAEFEVLTLGDMDGALVGLAMMEMPAADYVVGLSQAGRVKKMRNPRSV